MNVVRLDVKSMILLVGGYAVLITAFAAGIDRWLHGFENAVVLETARLVAREQAALLSDWSFGALERPDAKSRAMLRTRIEDLTQLSEVVASITVVDRAGFVVASDTQPAGRQALRPDVLFADGRRVRPRPTAASRFFQGGDYAIDVPLVEKDELVGYVEVELQSRRVSGLYLAARRQMLIAAVAGLAGVLLLGGLLQFQLSRRAAAVARTLEDAVPGPSEKPARQGVDEFGRMLKAAGRVRDALGEARRQTSRLQESFSALAQTLRIGVLLLRGDRQLDFANPRAVELFGAVSLEELRSRWPAVLPLLQPALRALGNGSAAVEIDGAGGGVQKLRLESYRLGGDDCDEYLMLLSDPEALDAVETDMRLANQLQSLSRVYRTVAHELRAPLGAMMIHLDLLRESFAADQGKESQRRSVAVVRGELERLNRTLSETLTQSLSAGDARDRFDLREALTETATLLSPQARRQKVELRTRLPEAPVVFVGYKDRLKQSLLNIAVNALEAMPAGGRLTLELEVEDSRATIRIQDTGSGIPPEMLARIYDRDFTTKGEGSGIGLHVAQALVQLHGGEIEVQSEPGRGTRVGVRLPIVPRG
jgi:signal transduction histidine kinase